MKYIFVIEALQLSLKAICDDNWPQCLTLVKRLYCTFQPLCDTGSITFYLLHKSYNTQVPYHKRTFCRRNMHMIRDWLFNNLIRFYFINTLLNIFSMGLVWGYQCACDNYSTHWGRDKMDNILQAAFSNVFSPRKMFDSIKISLKFVPKVLIENKPTLAQIMALCWSCDMPLSEPMMG